MKKTFLFCLFTLMTFNVWAQHFTLWYGVSSTKVGYWGQKDRVFGATNFGLDFTGTIKGNWKWTVGVGYNQKGENIYQKMNYAQAEGNISYVVWHKSAFRVSALAGMYGAFAKDHVYPLYVFSTRAGKGSPYDFEYKANLYGWQTGVKVDYHHFSLKLGYEKSRNGLGKSSGCPRINQLFARVGYSFK